MAFCAKCGSLAAGEAVFCSGCGQKLAESETSVLPLSDVSAPPIGKALPTEEPLSQAWERRFAAIESAGGPSLPKYNQLSPQDRRALTVSASNFWAFVFGPLYYLAKGMWRKAITLGTIGVTAAFAFEFAMLSVGVSDHLASGASNMVVPVLFAMRANVDYYKHVRLGDRGWL